MDRWLTSPASARPMATSSASCPTRNGPATCCSDPRTATGCSRPCSPPPPGGPACGSARRPGDPRLLEDRRRHAELPPGGVADALALPVGLGGGDEVLLEPRQVDLRPER